MSELYLEKPLNQDHAMKFIKTQESESPEIILISVRCDAQGTNPGKNGDTPNLAVVQLLAEGCGMKRLESEHRSGTSDQQEGGRLPTWGS